MRWIWEKGGVGNRTRWEKEKGDRRSVERI